MSAIEHFLSSSNKKRERIFKLLEKLAKSNDTDIAKVIINGIALYGIAEEETKQKGYKIGIIDRNEVIKEIKVDWS
ncbi:MAG: hypothetical protein QNJ64_07020 [Crocosphaera sp.]|nr:hypothetical protein [Crocosphaera sp.]